MDFRECVGLDKKKGKRRELAVSQTALFDAIRSRDDRSERTAVPRRANENRPPRENQDEAFQ
jgi:hypothetical protein